MRTRATLRPFALLVLTMLALLATPASAHNVPIDALVKMFIKPQGHTLNILVRVPLASDMDAEFPRRPDGYVDLQHVDPFLREAAKIMLQENMEVYEGDRLLPEPRITSVRMSLDSDPSFATYRGAMAHVMAAPLNPATSIYWEQGKLDVLFEYPIRSDHSYFSIHAAFDRLAMHEVTAVQFFAANGSSRVYELEGDAGLVRLDPSWLNAASRFVVMGFNHIMEGTDHLLFLLCLVIPFRRVRPLIPIVTAFTVAHSITLIASAYHYAPDFLWFPPLIETLIAMSIVYMALENIVILHPTRRWIITFCFGLVHGFGFSFGLQHILQFAGSHLLTSLLSFNVGVELGQLLVLALFVPALNLLFRYVVAERMGTIIVSAMVGHTAWHWMSDRFDVLRKFPWPTISYGELANGLPWLIAAVAVAAGLWLLSNMIKRWMTHGQADTSAQVGAAKS